MTQKELLALPHLAVAEVNEKWVHIHTEEGYYITDFDQDDDYFYYKDFFCAYLPIKEEYPNYQAIDNAKHKENIAKKMEAFRLKQEEENKKRKELLENEFEK